MNTIQYISSALHINNPIDCRRLSFSVSFYKLNQHQVMELCNGLLQWIYKYTDSNFVYDWILNGKRIGSKKLWDQMAMPFDPKLGISVGFDAYAISPMVYNLTTLRKYQRYAFYENMESMINWGGNPNVSVDYPNYFDHHFPSSRPDNKELQELVYKLFCEPKGIMKAYHNEADLTGTFFASDYQKHPGLYYGNAEFSFGAFCLGENVDFVAEDFAQLAITVAKSFCHINAHVSLQPKSMQGSPYMQYFGKYIAHDGSHERAGCSMREWYPTYYLCSLEWLNIVSPLAREHIVHAPQALCNTVSIQEVPCGGLLIKSSLPITLYSVFDSHMLKNILRPALCPGMSSVPLKALFPSGEKSRIYEWCPRRDWSIVPVEKEEIEIVGENLVFRRQWAGSPASSR